MVAQKSIDPMTAQRYQLSPYADVYGYMDDMLLLRRRDTKQSVLLSRRSDVHRRNVKAGNGYNEHC